MAAHPVHHGTIAATGRLLPILLPPERREVEVVIRAEEYVYAAREGRIGMKDAISIPKEYTHAV